MGEEEAIFELLLKILNRNDYLYNVTHRIILNLLVSSRNQDKITANQLNKLRITFVGVGLKWLLQTITSAQTNASYMRTVEILRCCATCGYIYMKLVW
jgi:hypothetical protein